MGRYLIRIECPEERFIAWSTITDSPVSYGMTEAELVDWTRFQYGEVGVTELPWRLERCRANGTSAHNEASAESVIVANRAGPGETELSMGEIVAAYGKPPRDATP